MVSISLVQIDCGGRFVGVLVITVDDGDELGRALEGPAANAVAGDFSEPALDQIAGSCWWERSESARENDG